MCRCWWCAVPSRTLKDRVRLNPPPPPAGLPPSSATRPGSAVVGGAVTSGRFGRTFWTLNTIEMWERLAFYNLRVMAPIYIMQADNPGGLHLTAADKGTIYAWWAVVPIAAADRHRRFRGPVRLQAHPGFRDLADDGGLPDDRVAARRVLDQQLLGLLLRHPDAGHRHGVLQAQLAGIAGAQSDQGQLLDGLGILLLGGERGRVRRPFSADDPARA